MYILVYMIGDIEVSEVWFPLWHGPIEDYMNRKDLKVKEINESSKNTKD
jgi:hypothetical protein